MQIWAEDEKTQKTKDEGKSVIQSVCMSAAGKGEKGKMKGKESTVKFEACI